MRAIVLMLIFVFATVVPIQAETTGQGANCQEVPREFHHTLGWSKYWGLLTSGGTVKVFPSTGDVIAFVRIAECGGRYLIAFWRGGQWATHFMTSWGYVQAQIVGATASSWASVIVQRAFLLILTPCPGTWLGHPDAFTRPCPTGGEQT